MSSKRIFVWSRAFAVFATIHLCIVLATMARKHLHGNNFLWPEGQHDGLITWGLGIIGTALIAIALLKVLSSEKKPVRLTRCFLFAFLNACGAVALGIAAARVFPDVFDMAAHSEAWALYVLFSLAVFIGLAIAAARMRSSEMNMEKEVTVSNDKSQYRIKLNRKH